MKRILITGLLAVGALLSGCTMYTQDANGNVVAPAVVPVPLPLVDNGYAPVVSDYVGLPFLGDWGGGWNGGYYNTGYYHTNWNHGGYYNHNWNGYPGGDNRQGVVWHGTNRGGAAWHGPRGGGSIVVRRGAAGGYHGGGFHGHR